MVVIARLLGLLARTMGRLDDAGAHFEDALAFCRKAGCRPELAWTCYDYAETLLHPSTGSGRAAWLLPPIGEGNAKKQGFLEEAKSFLFTGLGQY